MRLLAQGIPQPTHAGALGGALALDADAAMAGPGAQRLFGVVVILVVAPLDVGHHVDKIAVIEAQRQLAHHVVADKIAHRADDQKLTAAGLIVGLLVIDKTCGYLQGVVELAVFKDIELLGQLVDHQAVLLADLLFLQHIGADIALRQLIPCLDLRVVEGTGIGFHKGPSVTAGLQHMQAL
ncbi:hypothetical protein SDC9_105292 [bioreactor metagenome]|uniref:Uncharacterized protein n=1 Tax=bioreactor metagenome TaxID=1076179 RepID=A0A645B1L8_9ZZZZ